jgi:diketogulonate reductase-like aldo/keto reductase
VSNFNLEQLQEIIKTARVKPAINQVGSFLITLPIYENHCNGQFQIMFHPYNYATQKAIVEYGAKHGIVTEGYSPLTYVYLGPLNLRHKLTISTARYVNRSLTKMPGGPLDPVVSAIGTRINASPAQVLLKWVRAKGVVVVT